MRMNWIETQISNLNHLTEFNVMQTSHLKHLMVISHWTKRNYIEEKVSLSTRLLDFPGREVAGLGGAQWMVEHQNRFGYTVDEVSINHFMSFLCGCSLRIVFQQITVQMCVQHFLSPGFFPWFCWL